MVRARVPSYYSGILLFFGVLWVLFLLRPTIRAKFSCALVHRSYLDTHILAWMSRCNATLRYDMKLKPTSIKPAIVSVW